VEGYEWLVSAEADHSSGFFVMTSRFYESVHEINFEEAHGGGKLPLKTLCGHPRKLAVSASVFRAKWCG